MSAAFGLAVEAARQDSECDEPFYGESIHVNPWLDPCPRREGAAHGASASERRAPKARSA
jgi:hypothetical protein